MSGAPAPPPLSVFATALEAGFLMQEAATVLALRGAALSALPPRSGLEALRMVVEKPPAFAASARAAWIAAATGRRADEALSAALRPLRTEARANLARLSRA